MPEQNRDTLARLVRLPTPRVIRKVRRMSESLWAFYEDALKLILTGSTSKSLSAQQQGIFVVMRGQGMRDDAGNPTTERHLPGVRKRAYCGVDDENEDNQKHETMYYIPGLFKYMVEVFEWSILAPSADLNYLNSLRDERGQPMFMFSEVPGQELWDETTATQEYWNLFCREIEIKQKIAEADRTHHAGDPLKLEAQKRLRAALNSELAKVLKDLAALDGNTSGGPESNRPTAERDELLQTAANELAEKWKRDGKKGFSRREIAEELAQSDEWKEMTANRIERIIHKKWKRSP